LAQEQRTATLFIVATPLGNTADLSPRAAGVLAAADVVLAEDTRRTGLLLKALDVTARRLVSFHEHNEEARLPQVLAMLAEGLDVALVSDAGTPLLADPGYRLVRAAREAGYAVRPVPGPSAVVTALSAAGLAPYPFPSWAFRPAAPPRPAPCSPASGPPGPAWSFSSARTGWPIPWPWPWRPCPTGSVSSAGS